ncbi:hypothetical protein M595_2765 [Lyngbya aestuarii BL J]|uniref:Uncharacterized protein n=1 Tax=Lyngbya aestuarii BL J TaxID=1348334 RepID=U7QLB8_9CYAN|nr:hypothetical protein [Lyngbya aestuarii]ERT07216.1 hypothetical protein M595_2765 [Lyngbya aestuarii BL J]
MKIKEIEFSVTVKLRNNESSQLSLRAELEDWEDVEESLAYLQQKVVELSGSEAFILEYLPTRENNQKVVYKLDKTQQVYRNNRKRLDELIDEIKTLENRVTVAKELVERLDSYDCQNTTIKELSEMIETVKNLKGYQNRLRDRIDDKGGYGSDDSSMF